MRDDKTWPRRFLASPVSWTLAVVAVAILSGSCSTDSKSPAPSKQPTAQSGPSFVSFSSLSPAELKNYRVVLETSKGSIELEFFPDAAPEHVRNFLRLCQLGFYDHTAWHRVARRFVIQGGDLGTRRPRLGAAEMASGVRRLPPEISDLKHEEGTLSMARGDDPNSAETSFFICLTRQPKLDGKYTIFGRVVSGVETVERIANVHVKGETPVVRVELIRASVAKVESQKVNEDRKG
ncbi:MAG: peptidylprolyl isomerase [Acidobacteriota bacterium]